MPNKNEDIYDEMWAGNGEVREAYVNLKSWLENTPPETFRRKREEAEFLFRRLGITFAVYGEGGDPERLIPYDIVPRVLSGQKWREMEKGMEQRVRAINAFLADIYDKQEIVAAGVVPKEIIDANEAYIPEMRGVKPPSSVHAHIAGVDMVCVDGDFVVLEDNVRTPSGVSYMLGNREAEMRLFPELFSLHRIQAVDHYPDELRKRLQSVSPNQERMPRVVVLTPGRFNSAYFEHAFLADKMGVELVEGPDLFVDEDNVVYMRTTRGPQRVDVIYRRIDDAFLDPEAFNPDSVLGVRGLVGAYRAGNVAIANAIGNGVADDKAIYVYVPEMVRFYLGQEPILKNVPTFMGRKADDLKYIKDNLQDLVVKEVHGSGGYGMLVGPKSTKEECETYWKRIEADPDGFIAQPTLALSTCPTFVGEGVAPRHVDLRPFVLSGADGISIVPGGLTRVAMKEGSLVVNSSQGGGTKDTWVLED
ncbi:MAG: circularly permuted type 2 ATP-grasp protein [Minwuia sp.]|uniref:circularly permuted type 2 ATP-grasp protein n=1 Tax=Minwuia sp. TaxID=2493630 RepID=UPI003A870DFB